MSPIPIKLGVLYDAPTINPDTPTFRGMELRLEEFHAQGGVQGRQVELVFHAANAAHEGLPENAVAGWRHLAGNPEVVGILGPGITDNTVAVIDAVDEGKVPTIQWSGDETARGEWYFHFQAGSLPDEGLYLARLMAKLGHHRVGVLQAGVVGERYFAGFKQASQDLGLEIVSHQLAHVHATSVVPQMERIRDAAPDCALFLGMAEPTLAFGRAIRELGWDVPRFSNSAMLTMALDPKAIEVNEGIIWVDQYEPRNPVLARVEKAYADRYGQRPPPIFSVAIGYDMMTLMLEGLRKSTNLTRVGLKDGLERVHQLPCATGGLNPVMGFSPWDRQAIKGPDLFMFRTVRDGKVVTYEP
ncbi:MAG: ABC transporter substrate-binding protein [Dehalococcoidia bacterium]